MNSLKKIKEKANRIKNDIPVIYLALKKKETPIIAKILAGVTVGYALSPIDLIPDFIPVLGYVDDVLILPGLIALTIKCIPNEILDRCRLEVEVRNKVETKKKWMYSIPIFLIWFIFLFFVLKVIINVLK